MKFKRNYFFKGKLYKVGDDAIESTFGKAVWKELVKRKYVEKAKAPEEAEVLEEVETSEEVKE